MSSKQRSGKRRRDHDDATEFDGDEQPQKMVEAPDDIAHAAVQTGSVVEAPAAAAAATATATAGTSDRAATQGEMLSAISKKFAVACAQRAPITTLASTLGATASSGGSGGGGTSNVNTSATDRSMFVKDAKGEFPYLMLAGPAGKYTDATVFIVQKNNPLCKKHKLDKAKTVSAETAKSLGVMPAVQLTMAVFRGGIIHDFRSLTEESSNRG